MMLVLKDTQRVTISVTPVDAKGNPAQVDGAPVWSIVGPEVVALEVSENGLTCVVNTVGTLGTTQITVTADADIGEGIQTISGLLDIEVVSGMAVSLNVTAGVPEEIPAETEPEVTEPEVTEPEVTEPEVTEPEA
jgi:hypothetical protein